MKVFLILSIVFLFLGCGPSIKQDASACIGEVSRFRVYTTVQTLTQANGRIYWNFSDCVVAEQIDSVKKVEYKKAQTAIDNYKKIK